MTPRDAGRWLCWLLMAGLLAACTHVSPTHSEQQTIDADALRRQGHLFQALYRLEAQAAETGWTAGLARQAGDLWAEAGDVERALDLWAAAQVFDPSDVALARRLAQGDVELQRWPAAVDALERLLVLAPDDVWAHWQLGLLRSGANPPVAEAHLRATMTEPAYQPVALALLNAQRDNDELPPGMAAGLVLVSLELWPYAEVAFMYAADATAPYPLALAYAALTRSQQGKPAEALMQQAIALAPDDALVRYLQGLHLRATGDSLASLEALGLAVTLDPENPAYQAELASAYRLLGRLHEAEYWFEAAVRVSNGDARFQSLLAQFYADEAHNLTDAGVDALADAARVSDEADIQAGYGWALYLAGRQAEALTLLETLLHAEPDNARALYYRGRILVETGDVEAGHALLRRAAESAEAEIALEAQLLAESAASGAE